MRSAFSRVVSVCSIVASATAGLVAGDPTDDAGLAPLDATYVTSDYGTSTVEAELGKLLFFDNRLSGDGSISCATCHDPSQGWAFSDDLSRGYPGTVNWRNSPTIVNTKYLSRFFWSGSADSLEAQAEVAGTGALELHGAPALTEARLAAIPEYRRRFADAYGDKKPSISNVWRAIAAFERTIVQNDTPYDRYLRGDAAALNESQKRGFDLFKGKGRCTKCHNGALLTDQDYYNTGVPSSRRWTSDVLARISFDYMQGANGESAGDLPDDAGLYYRTKLHRDKGKFRTAPLRYTKYTAPYMHNGSFQTLREVVEFYNRGGGNNAFPATKSEKVVPLELSDSEVADLVTFLETLSGEQIRGDRPVVPSYPAQVAPR